MSSGVFSQSPVTEQNLSLLAERAAKDHEALVSELSDLAARAAESLLSLPEMGLSVGEGLLSLAESLDFSKKSAPADTLPKNLSRVGARLSAFSAEERAVFASLLPEKLAALGAPLTEADFLPEEPGSARVCYVRNPLSDEAFDVFSEELDDPRVSYVSALSDAAATVASGEKDYCLLPLEERGARIRSVGELLCRYDLKIASVTPVFGFAGDADMKYALCARAFRIPEIGEDDDRYLEIRLPEGGVPLSEVLSVAGGFCVSVYRVGMQKYGGENFCSVVFRDEGEEFLSLLSYLTMFVPAAVPVGIYKNLE